jgi:hypothetical protein
MYAGIIFAVARYRSVARNPGDEDQSIYDGVCSSNRFEEIYPNPWLAACLSVFLAAQ